MSSSAAQPPEWLQQARSQWTNTGAVRPPFAHEPASGQESVWDYPRPPAIVNDARSIEVRGRFGNVASSRRSIRVLETSHPPAFYLPPDSVADRLVGAPGRSHCEWKGQAEYIAEAEAPDVAVGWRYVSPYPDFQNWAGWVSFYPDRIDCFVDGHPVVAQAGGFYGGWITPDVVGPFKGEPGTAGW